MNKQEVLEDKITSILDSIEISRVCRNTDLNALNDQLISLQIQYKEIFGHFYHPAAMQVDDAFAIKYQKIRSIVMC